MTTQITRKEYTTVDDGGGVNGIVDLDFDVLGSRNFVFEYYLVVHAASVDMTFGRDTVGNEASGAKIVSASTESQSFGPYHYPGGPTKLREAGSIGGTCWVEIRQA